MPPKACQARAAGRLSFRLLFSGVVYAYRFDAMSGHENYLSGSGETPRPIAQLVQFGRSDVKTNSNCGTRRQKAEPRPFERQAPAAESVATDPRQMVWPETPSRRRQNYLKQ